MKYDVLFEPCLTVIDEDGSTKNTGLRDCLINAHRYKSICVPSQSSDKKQFVPLEYCALRFLITFIMDAYRNQMHSMEQIADLIEKGSFDADVIDSYIKICRKDGCTFDLLDEERPFLQTDRCTLENLKDNEKLSFDGWLKKKASTVGNITPLLACGNNDIFSRRVSIEEYADFFDVEFPSDIAEGKEMQARGHGIFIIGRIFSLFVVYPYRVISLRGTEWTRTCHEQWSSTAFYGNEG